MKKFLTGFSYNFSGFKFLISNKSLWKYCVIPFLINLLLLFLLVSLYVTCFSQIFVFITKPLGSLNVMDPHGVMLHVADVLLWLIRHVFMVIFFLFSIIMIFVFVFVLGSFINSPFYESLSEKVLILKGVIQDRPFSLKNIFTETWIGLKIEVIKTILFLSFYFVFFLISWIPLLGVLGGVVNFFFTAWLFAYGLCSYPMIIQKVSAPDILRWGRKNKIELVGFGLPSVIPFLGLLTIFFQVVGGTLFYLERHDEESSV